MTRYFRILIAASICFIVLLSVERSPERPLAQQPFPDSAEYADSAHTLAHGEGYYTYAHGGYRQPPRFPPGYAMALSPFAAVGAYPRDVQRGAKFWALIYVLIAIVSAWVIGGPIAGSIAALLIGTSPFARDSAGLILSDAFIATLTVMMLPLLRVLTRPGVRLAGAATGLAMLGRVTAGINLIAMLIAIPSRYYRSLLVFALPSLLGLALLQWAAYGSPFTTGYSYWGVESHFFSFSYVFGESVIREGPWIFPDHLNGQLLDWVCPCQVGGPQASLPNIAFYPLLLSGVFWVFSPPLIPLLGLLYAWKQRREPIGRYVLVVTILTLLIFVFYRYQGTRFMAGPGTMLVVLASVWLAQVGQKSWKLIHIFSRTQRAI